MKLKKMKITIKSPDQFKTELLTSLTDKKKHLQKDNEINFVGLESFMKIMTKSRIEIMMYLTNHKPKSIYELAKGLNRDFKHVHTDVKTLANLNLIELEVSKDSRKSIMAKAKYSGMDVNLAG